MNRVALISIHPEHAENILSGRKVFEYRKILPKNDVTHLVLYCTAPIKRIVAVVEVLHCITGSPSKVWSETSFGSGISRHFFRQYFAGQRTANAFNLGRAYKVKVPIELSSLSGTKVSPQSFCYLNDADVERIAGEQERQPVVPPTMLFLGGIHGVGKTTFCAKAFSPAGYKCITASSLISADRNRTETDKRVDDVSDNQVALLRQLSVEKTRNSRLLLDGHFTLLNKVGEVEPIKIDVFRSINPDLLILIKGPVAEIGNRLKQRDGKTWDASLINRFQTAEEEHANRIATCLGIPLKVINNDISPAIAARSMRAVK